jgi:hypothetical protein
MSVDINTVGFWQFALGYEKNCAQSQELALSPAKAIQQPANWL